MADRRQTAQRTERTYRHRSKRPVRISPHPVTPHDRDAAKANLQSRVIIAHDYLTQRGGAERVVLAMARAFPGSPIVTSLYEPASTFPEFGSQQVVTSTLQHVGLLRRYHRLGLPFYAPVFSNMHVEADLVLCSTSGWAHGISATGSRLLYVHNTARWLYQTDDYLRTHPPALRSIERMLGAPLRRWDQAHGSSAKLVLANSQTVRARLAQDWGVEAEVLYPPHAADPSAVQEPMPGLEPGYLLAVSRLVPHKRVDVLTAAMESLPKERLVVVGNGSQARELRQAAPPNCLFLGGISDTQLGWLYANSAAFVSAAFEDLGLAALEAMAFGTPVAVLRAGGFLETVVESETGVFFDHPEPREVVGAVRQLRAESLEHECIAKHAQRFDEASFTRQLRYFAQMTIA
jgi:glycosyltransferase involved in cell wall biosynthesis